jgi:hypothetical protein
LPLRGSDIAPFGAAILLRSDIQAALEGGLR